MSRQLVSQHGKVADVYENFEEMTERLAELSAEHRAGIIDNKTFEMEIKNAHTVIEAIKAKIVYERLRDRAPNIKFLNVGTDGPPMKKHALDS